MQLTRNDVQRLIDDTIDIADRLETASVVTRADAARLSQWNDIWNKLLEADQTHVVLRSNG